jgi:hypothetical protein
MKKKSSTNRRSFLKMTAGGVAGLSLVNMNKAFAAPTAWTPKMAINPNIDNMKVICCYDTTMLSGAVMTNFASQNNAVNANKVYANLDEMACRLAATTSLPAPTPDQAWKIILRSSKAWTDTKVAIKVNGVNTFLLPRIAIIAKLCKVLNGFGVQGKNIIIYDGCHDASGSTKYTPYCSLTDATKINAAVSVGNSLLGNRTPVTLEGWTSSALTCTADIALGNVDILINCAINKGHDRATNGYFTLCMKNHFGTFDPPAVYHASTASLISINKHDAIVGGNPVRQQLCIIDSLTGSIAHNPGAAPDVPPPNRLIMGTFAPAVDYLCAKKVRVPIMKAVHDDTVVNSLMSYFGYTNTDPQWIEFTPGQSIAKPSTDHNERPRLTFELANRKIKPASVHFALESDLSRPVKISVFDTRGNLVFDRQVPASGIYRSTIAWNGKANNGREVPAGTYVIKAALGNWTGTEKMHVFR